MRNPGGLLECKKIADLAEWMDDIIVHDGPIVKDGHIALPDKPGLGVELNPDVLKAHLAPGEVYWS